jgi:HK97 family phage major capsid protein
MNHTPALDERIGELEAQLQALEIGDLRTRLQSERDRKLKLAHELLSRSDRGRMTEADYALWRKRIALAGEADNLDTVLEKLEARASTQAKVMASVTSEPRVYGLGSMHSFYRDTATLATGPLTSGFSGAAKRMERYSVELGHEMKCGTPEGLRAERIIREHSRVNDPEEHRRQTTSRILEARAGSTASASLGSFVTPVYSLGSTVYYKEPYRAFADQCGKGDLPSYGLTLEIPQVTGPAQVTHQSSEGDLLAETGVTAHYITVPVITEAGRVTLSQQLFDRAGPGYGADQCIGKQLQEHLDQQVSLACINAALAGANTVTNSGTFALTTASGSGGLYEDLAKAREAMADSAGNRLRATQVFTSSDFSNYCASLADAQGRPILLPHYEAEPWRSLVAQGDPQGQGWTGHMLPGSTPWFTDDSIPASGGNTQILVSRPGDTIILHEGAPVLQALVSGPEAPKMEVTLRLYSYLAVAVLRPAGTSVVGGSAYSASLK